jgi:hypothetical protein
MGQWGNVTEQSVYHTWPADSDGAPLAATSAVGQEGDQEAKLAKKLQNPGGGADQRTVR